MLVAIGIVESGEIHGPNRSQASDSKFENSWNMGLKSLFLASDDFLLLLSSAEAMDRLISRLVISVFPHYIVFPYMVPIVNNLAIFKNDMSGFSKFEI